jgi:hypothetical protein
MIFEKKNQMKCITMEWILELNGYQISFPPPSLPPPNPTYWTLDLKYLVFQANCLLVSIFYSCMKITFPPYCPLLA